jgi:hypothetical protein
MKCENSVGANVMQGNEIDEGLKDRIVSLQELLGKMMT